MNDSLFDSTLNVVVDTIRDTVLLPFADYRTENSIDSLSLALQPDVSIWGSFFKLLISLTLVIGIIIIFVWFFRKFMSKTISQTQQGHIGIVTTISLGQKNYLHIINISSKLFIVGSGPNGPSVIAPLPDDILTKTTKFEQSLSQAIENKNRHSLSGLSDILKKLKG